MVVDDRSIVGVVTGSVPPGLCVSLNEPGVARDLRRQRYGARVDPRERLAQLLGATGGHGSFSARRTAKPTDLHIDVVGFGPLTMPVSAAAAKRLIAIARPAQYGRGEQTLTDTSVRHTWQVPRSRVRIDKRRWNRTLDPMLAGLGDDLGLLEGSRLRAELHSFLVYSPGQFFLPHQDSEKSDDMVGTLTVTLPGTSAGGELIVQHGEEQISYRSSDKLLSFVAFYAGCRHEVQPVIRGYRVVLTYNLLLRGSGEPPAPEPGETAELAACLDEHFADHRRLVYLLDHQSTARGMSWRNLKGVDAERVRALAAAAQGSGCEIALALAEVHESWSAAEPDDRYDRDRYWYDRDEGEDGDDDDENGEGDSDAYELDELLESSVSLNAWIDRSGVSAPPVATDVRDDEVCATTPTRTLAPYESEYEGFMGNYGNTMDRWYRRGAVLLWPTRLDFEVRAEASPQWALDALGVLIRDGQLDQARERAESLAPFWKDLRTADSADWLVGRRIALGPALAVASGLDSADHAALLLAPFRLQQLTPADAAALAALAERHGESWTSALFAEWNSLPSWRFAHDSETWAAALPGLCGALREADGLPVARMVLAMVRDHLAESLQQTRSITEPSRRAQALDQLAAPTAGLLVGAAIGQAPAITAAIVAVLADRDDRLRYAVSVLRAMPQQDPDIRTSSGFDPLAQTVIARGEARLARPPRAPDDWSIEPPRECDCPLCRVLNDFLADPGRRALDWPIKQESRRHVHDRIDRNELPVKHATRRVGRPYTLQLNKTPALFEREAQERAADEVDLQWLQSVSQ